MAPKKILPSLAAFLLFPSLVTSLQARTWTDVKGREIHADYISHTQSVVVLRMTNGKTYDVPLKHLSPADNRFINSGEAQKAIPDSGGNEAADMEEKGGDEESLNWDDEWPDSVKFEDDAEISVDKEDAEKNVFIYSSQNYRYTSDVRLSTSVVNSFVDLFEATRLCCRALPLAVDGGEKHDGKYDILLFEKFSSYVKAGGPPSSAGVFIGGKNIVMVPLSGLGVQKVGSGYMRDRDKSNKTLPHELTHQLTPAPYFRPGLRGWFSEGLAEYIGTTPYRSARFNLRTNLDDIEEYACAYGKDGNGGRAMGEEFSAPHLADFMFMPYAQFAGGSANFNYGYGLLLTTYFLRMDGDEDAALVKKMLKKVRATPRGTDPQAYIDILLNGRTYEELQEDIHDAWRSKGVKINFRSRKSASE